MGKCTTEKKELVVQEISRNCSMIRCRITKQTHRGGAFGKSDYVFDATNGISLRSMLCPDFMGNSVYVRGSKESSDCNTENVSIAHFNEIMEAVKEYNEYFKGEEKPMIPKKEKELVIHEVSRNSRNVKFMLAKQTHFGCKFGITTKEFTAKNDVCIISAFGTPEVYGDNTFYVLGDLSSSYKNTIISTTIRRFNRIECAVKEYNDHFTTKVPCKDIKKEVKKVVKKKVKIKEAKKLYITEIDRTPEYVKVIVAHQTHRNGCFGEDKDHFKASNGILLQSMSYPAYASIGAGIVFLQGNTKTFDNATFFIPIKQYYKVLIAVKEYNEYFSCSTTAKVKETCKKIKEKKILRIQQVNICHNKDIEIKIVEQSHRCDKFGEGTDSFTASNKVILRSIINPASAFGVIENKIYMYEESIKILIIR